MSNYDLIGVSLLVVSAIYLAYNLGYSAAMNELKGRVDALAKAVESRGDTPK